MLPEAVRGCAPPSPQELVPKGDAGESLGRFFTGDGVFVSLYEASGSAQIVFSSPTPGTFHRFDLAEGEAIICQQGSLVCAAGDVSVDLYIKKDIGTGLLGGEGFVMQKMTGPGTVFLSVAGYSQELLLEADEKVVFDTGALAIMDETCTLGIERISGFRNKLVGREGVYDTTVTGPGRVYLQTIFSNKLVSRILPFLNEF